MKKAEYYRLEDASDDESEILYDANEESSTLNTECSQF